jgi:HSP20 family protein
MITTYFELPGVRREEISLSVENGNLVVKGESKVLSDNAYLVNERKYGKFQRAVPLPCGITVSHSVIAIRFLSFLATRYQDAEVKAKVENGLLMVTYPKGSSYTAKVEIY